MGKLSNIWLSILLASQMSCGNPQSQATNISASLLWEKWKTEVVTEPQENAAQWSTSNAIFETLQEENDSIAYSVKPWSKVYKDSEWKEILLHSPKWVVIRNNEINEQESTQDFLCVEYRGHKAWINRTSLTENDSKSLEEIEKPTTEKVIKVNKSARKMEIFDQYGKNKVKEFKIAICSGDDGDKKLQWDWNTPVWKYYICFKNPASSFWTNPKTWWRLWSLQVSYPNSQDAFEWLIAWDITQAQFNSINASINSKWIPSQGTNLWNYIMIHGWGSEYDWTIWCMALDDSDMLRLYNYINTGVDLYIE